MIRLRLSTGAQTLERRRWGGAICFSSYGLRIGIRSSDRRELVALEPFLPPARQALRSSEVDRLYSLVVGVSRSRAAPGRRRYVVYADNELLVRTRDVQEVKDNIESDLRCFLAQRARGMVFVHAGVVGWNGRALVVAGKSLSGKSRLVAALVRAGAAYYSDEYAVFDGRGRVHPYPSLLSLRREPREYPLRISAEELGGRSASRPLPVGLVALLRYARGGRLRMRPLSRGRALLALLSHTLPVRQRPVEALETLRRAISPAAVVQGGRGEAESAAPLLLDVLEAGARLDGGRSAGEGP